MNILDRFPKQRMNWNTQTQRRSAENRQVMPNMLLNSGHRFVAPRPHLLCWLRNWRMPSVTAGPGIHSTQIPCRCVRRYAKHSGSAVAHANQPILRTPMTAPTSPRPRYQTYIVTVQIVFVPWRGLVVARCSICWKLWLKIMFSPINYCLEALCRCYPRSFYPTITG